MANAGRRLSPPRLSLDRANPLPLHVQLEQALRDQILKGHWRPGDLVPGEPDLCREFGVSRTVGWQALTHLTYEGLVVCE